MCNGLGYIQCTKENNKNIDNRELKLKQITLPSRKKKKKTRERKKKIKQIKNSKEQTKKTKLKNFEIQKVEILLFT